LRDSSVVGQLGNFVVCLTSALVSVQSIDRANSDLHSPPIKRMRNNDRLLRSLGLHSRPKIHCAMRRVH